MKKVTLIIILLVLASCMSNRTACPHHKNVPKDRQCDQFLLSYLETKYDNYFGKLI